MEFNETNTEERTPANVPINEKLISPSIPIKNPTMTTNNVAHVKNEVDFPSKQNVKMTLNTMERDLATL